MLQSPLCERALFLCSQTDNLACLDFLSKANGTSVISSYCIKCVPSPTSWIVIRFSCKMVPLFCSPKLPWAFLGWSNEILWMKALFQLWIYFPTVKGLVQVTHKSEWVHRATSSPRLPLASRSEAIQGVFIIGSSGLCILQHLCSFDSFAPSHRHQQGLH